MLRFFPLFTFIEHDYKGKAITCDKLSMQKNLVVMTTKIIAQTLFDI